MFSKTAFIGLLLATTAAAANDDKVLTPSSATRNLAHFLTYGANTVNLPSLTGYSTSPTELNGAQLKLQCAGGGTYYSSFTTVGFAFIGAIWRDSGNNEIGRITYEQPVSTYDQPMLFDISLNNVCPGPKLTIDLRDACGGDSKVVFDILDQSTVTPGSALGLVYIEGDGCGIVPVMVDYKVGIGGNPPLGDLWQLMSLDFAAGGCTGNNIRMILDTDSTVQVQGICQPPSTTTTTTTTTTTSTLPITPDPRNGGAMDDPHFKTWGGKWYDFMGACDLVLLHAPNFAPTMALDIHIRTKIRFEYSYIESAVVKIGEETLEVASFGDYFLNGISNVDKSATNMMISGFPIHYSHPSEKIHLFEIELGVGEKIILKTFKDMVSVKVEEVETKKFHGSQGMMGDFDSLGEMLGRDGLTVFEDPKALATEWQVRDDEPLLFVARQGPQYPQVCELPASTKESLRRRLGETMISQEEAEKACSNRSDDTKQACIYDVMATGDLDIADAGAF